MNLKGKTFRKVPILISIENPKEWRAEIADNYENYRTSKYEEINFEDLGFHFFFSVPMFEYYLFGSRSDAVEAAKEVIERSLKGKAKIWFN